MTISGAHKEQTGRSKDGTVERTECGASNEKWHYPGSPAKCCVGKGHSNSVGRQNHVGCENHEIGNISDDVDNRDNRHADTNGTRKIPTTYIKSQCKKKPHKMPPSFPYNLLVRITQLFGHEIQIIPSRIRKQSIVKGQRNASRLGQRSQKRLLKIVRLSTEEIRNSRGNDHQQSQNLHDRKGVRDTCHPFHIITIDDGKKAYEIKVDSE